MEKRCQVQVSPDMLRESDPRQLGAFRLSGRLAESSEGVVYLARDRAGREVSVAMLSRGAAADPAARERFVAAVERGRGLEAPPPVLAARTGGTAALWVAVSHVRGEPGAGAFLDTVNAAEGGGHRGPRVVPHWEGGGPQPAVRWPWRGGAGQHGPVAGRSANTGLLLALLAVLVLFLVLLLLVYHLLRQWPQPEEPFPQPGAKSSPSVEEPGPGEGPAVEEEPGPGDPGEEVPSIPTPLPEGGEEWGGVPEDSL